MKRVRAILTIMALLALASFGAQIAAGIATGTASSCSVNGSCPAPRPR